MGRQGVLQILIGDSRLHTGSAVVWIDLKDAVHAFQAQHYAAQDRYRGTSGAGAGASGYHRNCIPVAQYDDFHHLFMADRKYHSLGKCMTAAVVVSVGPAVSRIREQRILSDDRCQLLQKFGAEW